MINSIYYPSFETQNQNWLKFALLYLDKLSPIIPPTGEKYLSDEYKYITDSTDLIKIHSPLGAEGGMATLDAIELMEKILRFPSTFEKFFSENNILEKWRNKEYQNSTLFSEKYSHDWEVFCIDNGLAHYSHHGLYLAKDVVTIYMAILAQCIADSRGISPITDNKNLDKFSILLKKEEQDDLNTTDVAKGIIELKLPRNINELSYEDIIFHRNRDEFKEKQKAFHTELGAFLSGAEKNEKNFSEHLGTSLKDFSDDIALISTGTLTFGLGVWLMLGSDGDQSTQALEKMAGAANVTVGSVIAIRSTWKNTKSKRMARRYLSDIRAI